MNSDNLFTGIVLLITYISGVMLMIWHSFNFDHSAGWFVVGVLLYRAAIEVSRNERERGRAP